MKISNIANAYGIYNSQKPAISRKKTQTGGTQDNFNVSDKGKDFQLIMKTLKQSPDIREDKTADLQKKIESGSYDVSAEDVASKMLSAWSV